MTSSFQEIFSQVTFDQVVGSSDCYLTTHFQAKSNRPEETLVPNPRTIKSSQISIDTKNKIFDALYALALTEMEENIVLNINDRAFNNNQPIPCPPGGCFQAGKSWTYVWTRDTSYSVHLSLAAFKPQTSLNSLMFKTSPNRQGNNQQIVQDTGSGGSYPISSDRVVWALGAEKLLHYLLEDERKIFQNEAFEIVKNTIEQDRHVIFDPIDGLYGGEQSFLDWREQTYPRWVANDVIHIGMSKCLSTNLLHLNLLEFGAKLAQAVGENELFNQYQTWAENLRRTIQTRFYLEDTKLYSTFITTFLDKGAAHQFDLLGLTLAVLLNVATPEQKEDIIANYPILPSGPSVIWPQQQFTSIYHNRAIWPFVTAYWIKAARQVKNVVAVNHGIKSLIQGVIRYRSNMENFEMISGETYVAEGSTSGPVVDSQAQLWSIAGYLSMVNDIIFGLETSLDFNTNIQGIRFLPYITCEMRKEVFSDAQSLTLNNFPYQGKTISVTIKLPPSNTQTEGAYQISSVTLNNRVISPDGFIHSDTLQNHNQIEIELSENSQATSSEHQSSINLITDTENWQKLFAPKHSIVTFVSLEPESGQIQVNFNVDVEKSEELGFNIYRDGKLVAKELPGSQRSWVDPETNQSSPSYCYTVESYYCNDNLTIKNYSQKSPPSCYWGANYERVTEIKANELRYYDGRQYRDDEISWLHGYPHYENWGNYHDTLILEHYEPQVSGDHLLQVSAANGSGNVDTGITCAVKYVQVFDKATNSVIEQGVGYLIMPQTNSWTNLRDSSFVRVSLSLGKTYKIVISHDQYAINMSHFKHFENYTGNYGVGGKQEYNFVNIASLKILALAGKHSTS